MENEGKTVSEIQARMAALCSRSEQCSPDIRKKIIATGISSDDADGIIQKLKDEKFIDDERYVKAYTAEKFRINQWGRIKMRYYLHMKGLSDSLIQKGLETLDEDKYHLVLVQLMKKKARSVKKKNVYEKMGQVIRFVQNRGFEPELIHRYLSEVIKAP